MPPALGHGWRSSGESTRLATIGIRCAVLLLQIEGVELALLVSGWVVYGVSWIVMQCNLREVLMMMRIYAAKSSIVTSGAPVSVSSMCLRKFPVKWCN